MESFRNYEGEELMFCEFEANIDDPLKRTNLLIAMWDAVEEAFRNSGLIRLEEHSGEIHRTCELGRSEARFCTASRLNWSVELYEDTPNPPGRTGRDPTDPSFYIQFQVSTIITRAASYTQGFTAQLPASTSVTAPKTAVKLRIFNNFKRHLKLALQTHVVNNNDLWD